LLVFDKDSILPQIILTPFQPVKERTGYIELTGLIGIDTAEGTDLAELDAETGSAALVLLAISPRWRPPANDPRRRAALAAGSPQLVLVTKAGAESERLAKLLDAYAAEPDAAEVDVILCGPGEQERLLRDGRADVGLLHRPFDSIAGFDAEELGTQGQVVILPAGHPLTTRPHVTTAEVAALPGLPLPRWPGVDGRYPDGPGPKVRDHTQLLQLIALGRACSILPESAGAYLPDDLAAVPVPDAPQVTTVIAWPPHSHSRPVAALIRTATRL